MIIGCHVGMSSPEYLLGSCKEATSYNANTFMFYTGAPQNSIRTDLKYLKIEEARQYLKEHNIDIENVVVHAPYLINLANCEDVEKLNLSMNLLDTEVKRTLAIGTKYLVLHPGCSLKADKNVAIKQVSNCLNTIIDNNPGIVILIETMAGKGSEIGINFNEIKTIIDGVNNKDAIGVCLDTCHINDAGYDLTKIDDLLDEFDNIIGLDKLKVCHINDSKNERGAHKDRHENIGYGTIGFDNLCSFIYNKRLEGKIFILETPWVQCVRKDVYQYVAYPPYKFEIEMIRNRKFNENLEKDIDELYNK